jgi:hypothetical protein
MIDPIDNLRPWLNEPVNQRAVMDFIERHGKPLLLTEIRIGTGLTTRQVNRALPRLCDKGLLNRYKIPMSSTMPATGAPCIRMMWLYSLAETE